MPLTMAERSAEANVWNYISIIWMVESQTVVAMVTTLSLLGDMGIDAYRRREG